MQNIIVVAPGEGKSVTTGPTQTTFLTRNEDTGGQFSLVEHSLPPHVSGPPYHEHQQYNHAFYVLEGEMQFDAGEQTVRVGPGTFVLVPKGVAHTFSNPGADRARMLELDAPGGFEHSFEELGRGGSQGNDG